ncbi:MULTISPECIES: YckD family protein [unclassified Bacillus (in: firmicutes)]|uniref:YckD family protein n=1 Tax=unclassified Bacillus (in: firmicutes) TaxID=185979 RepID=UPI0013EED9B2|nr:MULTISPECIES: YckD family protein [unclassified Bacillus (in: firmicutes)]KAF6600701.1 YckD family protein [Bacillus sp. EKM420B]KAF6605105.1 YckD family protein [Bacillus sp. EKM417B]
MKKAALSLAAFFITAMVFTMPAHAETKMPSTMSLTEQQKKEIESLEKEVLEKRKHVISKYVEYGVLPKEKAEHIKQYMDRRFNMMKQNGFVPKPPPHKLEKRHHHS